ncbi:MAG: alpha-ketoglutarate-dependent dioxygenase AlkB [Gammaproteobacteria bacterium]|nr:alpha-ketoglutarate-dependent dioxygenase AlkB [Gammaproteobacteria bacterium]
MDGGCERFDPGDGALALYAQAFVAEAPAWFAALMAEVRWEQHWLSLFGRRIAAPRLSAWYAEPGCSYRYSGLSLAAQPFTPVLAQIRARTEALTGHGFNSVLLNLYRDGADGMSWHSDDEPELGPAPLIASVSLGATRRLLLRRRDAHDARFGLDLGDGSLLLMEPPLQCYWQHSVPKTRRAMGPRINLTWRRILTR